MYDDAGSIFQLSDDGIKMMKKHKIQIKKFNSIEKHFHRQYFHYRNHQNIVVIDGNVSYVGLRKFLTNIILLKMMMGLSIIIKIWLQHVLN